MSREMVYELIGYAASALVVTALLMTSLRRLRMVSLAGSIVFTTYGYLIESIPLMVVNISLMGINSWHLYRMSQVSEYFDHMSTGPDSAYLNRFLRNYGDDIASFFPEFDGLDDESVAIFVLRDLVPAGLWIAHPGDDGWIVDLDYAIPRYRDTKIGRYLHSPGSLPAGRKVVPQAIEVHKKYLRTMGYVERPDGSFVHDDG